MLFENLWKDSEFYNGSIKSWLQDNDIEIYSAHNEWKFVIAEWFIRTLDTGFKNIWL